MIRVGITGGIGAGKSSVSEMFKEYCKVPIFDSDAEAKELINEDENLIEEIKKLLGEDVYYKPDKHEDRELLARDAVAEMIFEDESLRKRMQEIVHPYLKEKFENWCEEHEDKPYVLFESAIIVELNLTDNFDKIIVVLADEDVRVNRLVEYRNFTEEGALARIRTQTSDAKRIEKADYIIKNNQNYKSNFHQNDLNRAKQEVETYGIDNIHPHYTNVIQDYEMHDERKGKLIERVKQIDHKIKYISYGSGNHQK